ncbi:MAG: MMPL family transporter [Verrucomicrobiae bacterium]|nr:MMPL family transporter [Verrucomicrobiae bacterium]
MLWETQHALPILLVSVVLVGLLVWQSGKLPKRLRGGLVSMPGSENELVRQIVEKEFSKAIAYPTVLIQEGLGDVSQLEESWNRSLKEVREIPQVKDVIDMHLGRRIVAELTVPTRSFKEAHETINAMRQASISSDFQVTNLTVTREAGIRVQVETEVRSFKEGEARRRTMDRGLEKIAFPVPPQLKMQVMRHPRRNFAMVEADVNSYQEAETLTADLQKRLHGLKLDLGNRVLVTGLPALFYDLNREATVSLRKAEWIGLPICFLVLIRVFGSPLAALLPIAVALIALSMGSAVMSKVGKYMEISMYVPSVLTMIGLGVGVDYMLILLARFRECVPKHENLDEAILEAMHLTSNTLFGSAFTVMIGFSALLFTPVALFRAIGVAGIVSILSSLVCIFLLSPPIFKICTPCLPSWRKAADRAGGGIWRKWTHVLVDHPVWCLSIGLAMMTGIGVCMLEIEPASLNPDTLPPKLESRHGYNICKNGFGAGWLMPAVLVVKSPEGLAEGDYLARERDFIRQLRKMESTFDAVGASDLSAAADQGFSIEIPSNFFISRSGRYHLILAMFNGNPLSLEGRRWVENVRKEGLGVWKKEDGFEFKAGGLVSSTMDLDRAIGSYLKLTIIFCMTTTIICLAWMYRTLLIPLQAIMMNILSISAAYGFLVLWFQKGWGTFMQPDGFGGSIGMNSVVILLLYCALFGLSMDYQVFLISRMAEEWRHSHNNKVAVRHGIELTGRVVTGAAAIMITIFLSFAFVSVFETRQFGTGMAVAIAFDSTIIRLLVFPALMLLIGQANWWWPFGRHKQDHLMSVPSPHAGPHSRHDFQKK